MKKPATSLVYIGTYADADRESIFLYQLNPQTGELNKIKGFVGGKKTSYMAIDKLRRHLYVVNERDDYEERESGAVCSFLIDRQTGYLTFLNRVASLGSLPVHVALEDSGKAVLVANYKTGNVAVLPIQENGELAEASDLRQHLGAGPDEERQESAHAHYTAFSPDRRLVFVVDLGIDKLLCYYLDATKGTLIPAKQPVAYAASPGTGPRQLSFHPNGYYAYIIHELKPIVTALCYDSINGTFIEIQTIETVPADYKGENKCGGIQVSPDGKYLYGSNRGHNSIVVYAIDEASGKLNLVEYMPSGGKWPREFTIDLTGNILLVANQKSNNIATFRIDKNTGRLHATGYQTEVKKPVFLMVVPI
ncbi:lactonase family protein [Pontibacter locisalis]|uniref:Lactonase family protein n=1 Tax=Pontibacter locisalis TaxID=1719035 RepID=A0ABW5IQE4_9BACT